MLTTYKPPRFEEQRPSSARRGYGGRHRKLRRMVLADEPQCRGYPPGSCDRPATELDHIDGDTENTARENLQPLCRRCHGRKSVAEQGGLRY